MGRTLPLAALACLTLLHSSFAVIHVAYTADSSSGDCSSSPSSCNLRAAVALAASNGESIRLADGTHSITDGSITVSADTKIIGGGDELVTISGSSNSGRLFTVETSVSLQIEVMGASLNLVGATVFHDHPPTPPPPGTYHHGIFGH